MRTPDQYERYKIANEALHAQNASLKLQVLMLERRLGELNVKLAKLTMENVELAQKKEDQWNKNHP